MPRPKREMVKHPLTPSMLTVMGDLEPTPLVTGPFDPESDWRRGGTPSRPQVRRALQVRVSRRRGSRCVGLTF